MIKLLCVACLAVLLYGCGATTNKGDEQQSDNATAKQAKDTEQVETTIPGSSASTWEEPEIIKNQQYGFSIELPAHWDADASQDGYAVTTAKGTEIKVFIELLQPELADILKPTCDSTKAFSFSEKLKGKQCFRNTACTFYTEKRDTRYNIFIINWMQLDMVEKSNILQFSKNLRLLKAAELLP